MGVAERRERERAERRAAILQAAGRVLDADGFDGMTMDTVASAAELSKGTLYLYFRSREALIAAIGEQRLRGMAESLRRRLPEAINGLDGVRIILETYANHFSRSHCRFALGWISSNAADDDSLPSFVAYRERLGTIVAMVIATIERGRRDETIRSEVDPKMAAMLLWGEFLGVAIVNLNRHRMRTRLPQYSFDVNGLFSAHVEGVLRKLAAPGVDIPEVEGLAFPAEVDPDPDRSKVWRREVGT
ncbi:MAG: TetR/AcrR family transcriptional regulator [Myxococcota bacterium]